MPLIPTPRRPSPASALESRRLEELLPSGVVIGMATTAVMLAAFEWLRWALSLPPQPILFTLIAAGALLWSAWWLRRMFQRVRPLNRGILGERFVADFLDYDPALRDLKYRAIHDIPFNIAGRKFNVDHVLIGPGGIYAIETKYRTKPGNEESGQVTVRVRADSIEVAGHQPDRDPIDQSLASARAIAEAIQSRSGQRVDVRPVLLFPGWFIEGRHDKVWVFSHKELPQWLEKEPTRISRADASRFESLILDHTEHTLKMSAE